jgi:CHAD domain-containing protein
MADNSLQRLACAYLQHQLQKFQKELAGVRSADRIESVHDARVTSRRIRAGIRFFDTCFPPQNTRKWLKQFRRIAKKLSQARDTDVLIAHVEKLLSKPDDKQKPYQRGINRLLLRLKQRRAKLQSKIVKSVDIFNARAVAGDMHGEIQKTLFNFKGRLIPLRSHFVFQHSDVQIKKQLEALLSHQDSLTNPLDKTGHHQMRIAAKNLRYTLEICDAAFEGGLKKFILAVKKIQTLLGDLHDRDVWIGYLPEFIAVEAQRTQRYFGDSRTFVPIQKGLEFLQGHCVSQRDILFGRAVKCWNTIVQENLWDKLQVVIDDRLSESQNPPEIIPSEPPVEVQP